MLFRCKKPLGKNKNYNWIVVERKSVKDFKEDMYDSFIEHVNKFWLKNTTIDRIDSKWNYCKENCRRATIKEQSYNKNNTLFIVINWEKLTSQSFAKKYWISEWLASSRISKYLKWQRTLESICKFWKTSSKEKWLKITKFFVDIDWKKYSCSEIAEITGITYEWVRARYKLYKKWKLSVEGLFKKEHRKTITHSVLCNINGKEYNKKTLAQVVWCNEVTAWSRIKKYNEWKLTKEQLFQKTFPWKNCF